MHYCVSTPRLGLLQDASLWLEADVLSVELDWTEWTDSADSRCELNSGLATPPAEADSLRSAA